MIILIILLYIVLPLYIFVNLLIPSHFVVCSKTTFASYAHAQTIVCRQLFAAEVVISSKPIKIERKIN